MRLLLASHVPPFPADSGGRQRTRLLWRALKEHGEVDVLLLVNRFNREAAAGAAAWGAEFGLKALVDEPQWIAGTAGRLLARAGLGGLASALAYHRDAGRRLLEASAAAAAAARRQVRLEDYDLVVGRYLRTVTTCGILGGPVPVAVDLDDYQPDLLRARLPHVDPVKRLTLRRQLRRTAEAWARLLPQCRHLWISLEADRRHPHLESATWLPNLPFGDTGEFPPDAAWEGADPRCLLVIGTWTYSANAAGLQQFLDAAWPRIRARQPAARLLVGGRVPEPQAGRWAGVAGVELAGYQADLARFYARGSQFIAPILFGAGTNIKVLEGAAFGRPGVLTRTAARGYGATLVPSGGLQVVDSVADMAGACLRNLEHPDAARAAGQAARDAVRGNFSWETFRDAVAAGVRKALA